MDVGGKVGGGGCELLETDENQSKALDRQDVTRRDFAASLGCELLPIVLLGGWYACPVGFAGAAVQIHSGTIPRPSAASCYDGCMISRGQTRG